MRTPKTLNHRRSFRSCYQRSFRSALIAVAVPSAGIFAFIWAPWSSLFCSAEYILFKLAILPGHELLLQHHGQGHGSSPIRGSATELFSRKCLLRRCYLLWSSCTPVAYLCCCSLLLAARRWLYLTWGVRWAGRQQCNVVLTLEGEAVNTSATVLPWLTDRMGCDCTAGLKEQFGTCSLS